MSDVTKVTQLVSGGAALFYFKTFALSKEVISVDLGQRGVRLQLCTLEGDIIFGTSHHHDQEHTGLDRNPVALLRLMWQPL